jgi:hypothetical protein
MKQFQIFAKLKAARGEVTEVIDVCLQGEKSQFAAEILLNMSDAMNLQLFAYVAKAFMKAERFDAVGQIYERLEKSAKVLEAHHLGHLYSRTLGVTKAASAENIVAIEKE